MLSGSAFNVIAATSTMILLYHALQNFYSTTRQRSWIITAFASVIMTLASIPFVLDVLLSWGDITALRPRGQLASFVCRAFQGLLLADLVVGCRYYRSHVTICWGWIHHSIYIILLHYMIQREWAHGFCLCAVMELPTFHLSISFLHPRFRHDWLFCALFLATRIIFHLFLFLVFCLPVGISMAQGSRLPAMFLALAFPGHFMWFMQSVRRAVRGNEKHGASQHDASECHRSSISRDTVKSSHADAVDLSSAPRTAFLDRGIVSQAYSTATLTVLDDSTWNHGNMLIIESL